MDLGGDQVTNSPTGSTRPLSLLVQSVKDQLAGPDSYLSPRARSRPGLADRTADVPETVLHAWVAEVTAQQSIRNIADLHRAAATGQMPPVADWDGAARVAVELAGTLRGAGNRAARAAFESTRFVDSDLAFSLNRVVALAPNAHGLASGLAGTASRITEFAGHAIVSWRQSAGLGDDEVRDISPKTLGAQLQACAQKSGSWSESRCLRTVRSVHSSTHIAL